MNTYIKKTEENPILLRDGGLPYFYFPILEETGLVRQAFSTRIGGVSQGQYATLNFATNLGDTKEHVIENYKRLCKASGFNFQKLIRSTQTHTTNVAVVTEDMVGEDRSFEDMKPFQDIDGMITNVRGAVLATSYADCVPLYFLDPVHKAIGLSHSGRKGTVGKMGAVTIRKMHEVYGSDPADLIACIGPSICQDCYEVGTEVYDEFTEVFPTELVEKIFRPNENGRYQLDLWETNRFILLEAGIKEEHLAVTNVCTCCNHELLFSHRYTKGKRGNLNAFLSLI